MTNTTTTLTLEAIIEVHKLLNQMGEKTTPQNIATECGVKKTTMMKFINDNIDHFQVTRWAHKDKRGKIDKEWLIVDAIYADPAYNPHAPQYVERRKKEHIIRLYQAEYYRYVFGCYLSDRHEEWENQPDDVAKYAAIPEVQHPVKFWYGGFYDSYQVDFDNGFKKDDAEKVFNAMIAAGLTPYVNGKKALTYKDLIQELQ